MVFLGIVLGSATGAFVFKRFDYRTTIWVSLIINGLFLFYFTQVSKYSYLGASRFISGFFQVFIIIYKPVFVDTFASRKQKPIFMSLILVSPPLGVVFGYLLTAFLLQRNLGTWQSSFKIQSLISITAASIVIIFPRMYFDINKAIASKRKFIARKKEE